MDSTRKLWILLAAVLLGAFAVLGFFGREVYRQAPPIPERVVAYDGTEVMTRDDILRGQQVWQSMGGQQVGSIWGHGAYQAPDWSADWLHREAESLLDVWSEKDHGKAYAALDVEQQAALRERLRREMRTNTYDESTGTIRISPARAAAIERTASHYMALFGTDPALAQLRSDYALHDDAVPDLARRQSMTDFFFWTS